jgi:phosphatidylinositol-3-phosphatase
MKKTLAAAIALAAAATFAGSARATEGGIPQGTFGHLDHVFLIVMENESETDILGNPNVPFINNYVTQANQATNYFAVGHPSAPNYLEMVAGSNFNLQSDYWPAWVGTGCVDNQPGSTGCNNPLPPIAGNVLDNPVVATATTATDCNGQLDVSGTPAQNNCALYNYPSIYATGVSIADQLVAKGLSWKSYQESLPDTQPTLANGQPNAFGVNYADGTFSNLSPTQVFTDAGSSGVQKLYAVKHNPFAYFKKVQEHTTGPMGLDRIVDFDGPNGLWADLQTGDVPSLSFIVPNQCHDQHSAGGGSKLCTTAADFLRMGDAEVKKLIDGIKASSAWKHGRNAIVLVYDENDYEFDQANKVVMTVETSYGTNGKTSNVAYDHFSLLRTLEAGFHVPCLNHACDGTSKVMNDLFGG